MSDSASTCKDNVVVVREETREEAESTREIGARRRNGRSDCTLVRPLTVQSLTGLALSCLRASRSLYAAFRHVIGGAHCEYCGVELTMLQLTKEGVRQRKASGAVRRANFPFNLSLDRRDPGRLGGHYALNNLAVVS